MKANKQSKIKVPKSGFKRSRFNWSHDVNTTFSWGEIQPTMCKLLIPNSNTTVQAQSLVRLAPMVAPTFGRVKLTTFSQFVPCADIFPNFEQMLAQEPITRNGKTIVPKEIPSIPLGQLSSYVLFGARTTLYFADSAADAKKGKYKTRYKKISSNGNSWVVDQTMTDILSEVQTVGLFKSVAGGINHSSTDGIFPHVPRLGDHGDTTGTRLVWFPRVGTTFLADSFDGDGVHVPGDASYGITLGTKDFTSLFPIDRSINPDDVRHTASVLSDWDDTCREVTMDSADYVVELNYLIPGSQQGSTRSVALAFELSDYGKRLRKILQGCGYQIDFASTEKVSILPLLAQYKAYFDVFGLQLYQGWETTGCAGLIDYINNNFVTHINGFDYTSSERQMFSLPCYDSPNDGMTVNNSRFVDFMLGELGNEFYTEDPDFIGAHLGKLAVSPRVTRDGFISVDNNGILIDDLNVANATTSITNGLTTGQTEPFDFGTDGNINIEREIQTNVNGAVHAYISKLYHGEVDTEFLKRVYKWTNRNTILGREIAKILRAQGLGKYVDECKSNYIGSTDNLITISDVVSTAATSDAVLGEFGGKGLQYCSDKTLSFENDEYGYWITLSTVVPEAGYVQGIDPTVKALDKFNLYNPDFDALGMELSSKDLVVGTRYNIPPRTSSSEVIISQNRKGFGFVPRYSKFKVCQNLVNGDFNRHNKRNVYLPYTLDRQININDYDTSKEYYKQESSITDNSTSYVTLNRSQTTNNMPIAGNIWRIPTKYGFLGDFNRIFYNVGKRDDDLYKQGDSSTPIDWISGFSDYNDDNFLAHGILDCQCYAPMKPIEDSYGLEDDDPQKAGAEFVAKA